MRNFFIKNWKTTFTGILVLILIVIYSINIITTEQFLTITAFLVSIGLFVSKDGDKTE